jgi:Zn-dependent protease
MKMFFWRLGMNDFSWLIDKLYYLPGIFVGLSFHEFAHGLAAYWMGDDTAKNAGRLTVDPRAHIDPLGFLTLLLAGFGWAKPVPINPYSFKNRRVGTIIVSLAGPLMNLFLAFITLIIIYVAYNIVGYDNEVVYNVISAMFIVNIVLCVFNLIPIPPLDGSKILASFLPDSLEMKMYAYERYSYFILLALIFTNVLDLILDPTVLFLMTFLDNIVFYLFNLFGLL